MSGKIVVERGEGVLTIGLSNPAKRNAISMAMYDDLERALRSAGQDQSLRVLILRGDGGAFAGGTDIEDLKRIGDGRQGVAYELRMEEVQRALLDLRIPVISIVRGACVGGGLVLAALSDFVYCTPEARFGSPIARTLGNTVSATSLARLQSCFGRRATAQMLLLARLFSAEDAYRAGFVTSIVEDSELDGAVQEAVTEIRQLAPLTLRSSKELERRIDKGLAEIPDEDVFEQIYGTADFREGVRAFTSKQKPNFHGH